jgi:hypothetical protein
MNTDFLSMFICVIRVPINPHLPKANQLAENPRKFAKSARYCCKLAARLRRSLHPLNALVNPVAEVAVDGQ